MARLVVALGPGVGFSPSDLAETWDGDEEASSIGRARVDAPAKGIFLADVLALVVIPLLVNVGSSAAYDLMRRLVFEARSGRPQERDLELVEVAGPDGDRILVVRVRETET